MKSWKKPTPDQVNKAISFLGYAEQYRHFFDLLENPEWIEPLKKKKFFSNPPSPDRDEVRGTIGFPVWPESRYLARMAELKPEIVLSIILSIPDTENVRVYEDFADAALKMPAILAVRLLNKAKIWACSKYQLRLPDKLGELVAHLAQDGQSTAALDLARVLLEVLPDTDDTYGEEKEYNFPPKARTRINVWDYNEILKKNIPTLLKATKIQGFGLICDLLSDAIKFSRREEVGLDEQDYSYIWRRAVEDDDPNLTHGIEDILVTAVRNAAEQLINDDAAILAEIVRKLDSQRWKIFKRIGLHLLRLYGKAVPELVANKLTDRDLFEDYTVRHEYGLLVGEQFGILPSEKQQIILSWIAQGPDLEELKKGWSEQPGKQPPEEDIVSYQEKWKLGWLDWFHEKLSADWKQIYSDLRKKYGAPERFESGVSGAVWVGPTSPKSSEEFQAMTVVDIVAYLKDWRLAEEPFGHSPEGLNRALSSAISLDPERFALEAVAFKNTEPTYVRALISGLRAALKQGKTFEWSPVLELCLWAVRQTRIIAPRPIRPLRDSDPDWGMTRKAIADLLRAGFEQEPGIPYKKRQLVWQILKPLTTDPDPTPEHEARFGGSNMDPATLSINAVRGEAMHAVIRYALWIRRHQEKEPTAKQLIEHGFDEMNEVRDVLNEHLDVMRDPATSIRAVYGQWLPWLVLLDVKWVRERLATIFPSDPALNLYRDAAWDTYIVFCKPYDNVIDVVQEQYGAAIDRIGVERQGKLIADPNRKLAEHLMTFYWRGKLDLSGDLLSRFWSKSSTLIRGHALEFIGRSLKHTKETVPAQILDRLKVLWEKRLSVAQSGAPDIYRDEMAAFGYWFISGKYPDAWAMAQLLESLKLSQKTKQEHVVIERIAKLVQNMPGESVQCLEMIAKGDREGWKIHQSRDEVRSILALALQTHAASSAENLIHYLGSRGYFDFGDLLKSSESPLI